MIAHFNAPKVIVQSMADIDTPVVETTLASAAATTYRDAGEGTTLVWFSDDTPARSQNPNSIN